MQLLTPALNLGCRSKATCFQLPWLHKIQGWLTTNTLESRRNGTFLFLQWGLGGAGLLAIPGEKCTPHPLPFAIQTESLSLALVNTDVSGNCLWQEAWVLAFSGGVLCIHVLLPSWGFAFSVFSVGLHQGGPDHIVHCSGSLDPRPYFVESFHGSLFYHFLFLIEVQLTYNVINIVISGIQQWFSYTSFSDSFPL